MLKQHTHKVCLDGKHRKAAAPNGADRKPQRRDWPRTPHPGSRSTPAQSSLDSSHPCARSGELHHQGTNFRWCNLILAKAWPSLTTGRPLSSSLFNTTPPRPFHSAQVARTGKMPPPAWPCTGKQARGTAEKWHPGISSAQPLIARRTPTSAYLCTTVSTEPARCAHRALWHAASQQHARSATPSNCPAERLSSLGDQFSQSWPCPCHSCNVGTCLNSGQGENGRVAGWGVGRWQLFLLLALDRPGDAGRVVAPNPAWLAVPPGPHMIHRIPLDRTHRFRKPGR